MSIASKYRPHYTYDEYCQWEGNWELIEGMPYAMSPAPVPSHQRASIRLGFELELALQKGCKKCKLYHPIDWKISDDTILQPDLLIVCNKIEKKYLDFAPALIVEILSPATATASKDRNEKMEIYEEQGVKYYIIVDPQFKKVEIYQIINKKYEPVAITPTEFLFELEDDCSIDVSLTDIWE
ncbi:MAG: Uma2 family endonuclease [Bacteroidetes bacterium]|nr:Uma2 family endonuclease [Bacteroidota bacterium]